MIPSTNRLDVMEKQIKFLHIGKLSGALIMVLRYNKWLAFFFFFFAIHHKPKLNCSVYASSVYLSELPTLIVILLRV